MSPLLAAGLAAGLVVGVPPAMLALVVLAWYAPVAALAVTAGGAVVAARRRRRAPDSEAARLVALASELRAGASLRAAVATLSPQVARAALGGRPVSEIVTGLETVLPRHGALVSKVVALADRLGGGVAPMFEELAVGALEADELAGELKAASAPALIQGALVGGAPAVLLVRLGFSGRLAELAASGPAGAVLVVAGTGLVVVGTATIGFLVWRARR